MESASRFLRSGPLEAWVIVNLRRSDISHSRRSRECCATTERMLKLVLENCGYTVSIGVFTRPHGRRWRGPMPQGPMPQESSVGLSSWFRRSTAQSQVVSGPGGPRSRPRGRGRKDPKGTARTAWPGGYGPEDNAELDWTIHPIRALLKTSAPRVVHPSLP